MEVYLKYKVKIQTFKFCYNAFILSEMKSTDADFEREKFILNYENNLKEKNNNKI